MDFQEIMKQAQAMQARMAELQDRLAAAEVTGAAGGGLVQVTVNGKGETRRVRIDPSLLKPEEASILEDLIAAAANDAKSKVEQQLQQEMSRMTGGMKLPPGFPGAS